MNDNEYGKSIFNLTDDGKKELVISDKDNIIYTLKKNAEGSNGESVDQIDQIRVVDEENGGYTKRIIYSDRNMQNQKKKHTASDKVFIFAVLAFIIGVAVFMIFFAS